MGTPFMTEIRIMSFNFAPKGWAMCNGQLLPINQNQAIFSLLGTTYGGNGQTTFALPDLRGRVSLHTGQSFTLGQRGGEEAHTVSISEMAAHVHVPNADAKAGNATVSVPLTAVPGNASPTLIYSTGASGMQAVAMAPGMVTNTGGSQAHENRQPYLCLSFCIALQGIFPSRN